jgi:N-acyl-D-aspartate/D-glutamate deacylase
LTLRTILRLLPALALAAHSLSAQQHVDVLIKGGTLVDGTGAAARQADLGVTGDRVTFVGNAATSQVTGKRTIDATGLVVAAGFIDAHTHTAGDLTNAQRKGNVAYLMQGVTTVITNNDGGGIGLAKMFDTWTRQGLGTNAAAYVGHGSVRGTVMGASGMAPTQAQLEAMKKLVADAMSEGALGLSTGLYYAPGSFAKTEEVIELAKVAAQRGGVYDSHMRDESSYTIGLIGSVNETIRIAREARIPANIAHIKALGVDVWGQPDSVIKLVRAARAQGLQITADQYPWTASGTGVSAALLPRWVEEGGNEMMRKRLQDPELQEKIRAEMTDNMRRRGGAASLLMTSTRVPGILGKNLEQIAKERVKDPITTAIEIILAGGSSVASFNMNEKDIRRFMQEDWVATSSDGSDGHPRKYATYPKLLHDYVYADNVLTIEKAVERSSSRVAKAAKIKDRGTLANGMFADVIVFDPKTINGRATYERPTELAVGMRYVLVNGQVAVDDGKYNGSTHGRVLKGAGAK